jgi:SAM-dependent methyltransferase
MAGDAGFRFFLSLLTEAGIEGAEEIVRLSRDCVSHFGSRASDGYPNPLTERWYRSLDAELPDFGVYDDAEYVSEAWTCWAVYSRRYLREVRKKRLFEVGPGRGVLDLGCGIGVTTAALAEMFPGSDVVGTQLPESLQWRVASVLARRTGFRLEESAAALRGWECDLALASEYFEHFERPIDHLREILRNVRPRAWLVANAFGARSIGHFRWYQSDDGPVDGGSFGRVFAKEMRAQGYRSVSSGFWNNRPGVWVLAGEAERPARQETSLTEPAPLPSAPRADLPIEVVPLSSLRPHPRNYREHPPDQIAHLQASLRANGFYRPVVIARDGTVLAGHGVVKAALAMGIERGPAVRLDLEPDDSRALRILAGDNEVARLAEIDDRTLTEMLRELAKLPAGLEGTGFDEAQLAALAMVTRGADELPDLDAAAAWVGLPGYEEGEDQLKLVVLFEDEAGRAAFVEKIGATNIYRKKKTWSVRWPLSEREDVAGLRFEEAPKT